MYTIKLKDKEFPIKFDLNVIEAIQKRYTDISKVGEMLRDFSEQKWILTTIINEGIACQNYFDGTNNSPITEQQMGMMLDINSVNEEMEKSIVGAFNECLGEEKNLTAEQLKTISREILRKTK